MKSRDQRYSRLIIYKLLDVNYYISRAVLSLSSRPLLHSLQLRLPIHTKSENLRLPSRNAFALALVLCLEVAARLQGEILGPAARLDVEDIVLKEGLGVRVVELLGEEDPGRGFIHQGEEEPGLAPCLLAPARIAICLHEMGT